MVLVGELLFNMKATGVQNATKQLGGFQKAFNILREKMGPALDTLKEAFGQFGIVASVALIKLINASPRLRAQFEILNLRSNELFRTFGDSLAPAIETLGDLIGDLADWFDGLDPNLRNAIILGFQVVAAISAIILIIGGLLALGNPIIRFLAAIGLSVASLSYSWETNFLGMRSNVEALLTAIGPILDGISSLFEGTITNIGSIVDSLSPALDFFVDIVTIGFGAITLVAVDVINTFNDILGLLGELNTVNIAAAMGAIIITVQDMVESVLDSLDGIIQWFADFVKTITSGELLGNLYDAGLAVMKAFLDGIAAAFVLASDLVTAGFKEVSKYFGGSLPEKGPLQHVDTMGEDLGRFYLEGINRGLQNNQTSNIFNRNFNIQRIDMNVAGADLRSVDAFKGRIDTTIRKSSVY